MIFFSRMVEKAQWRDEKDSLVDCSSNDNIPLHITNNFMTPNIDICILLLNILLKIQPMDVGIIAIFMWYYRCFYMQNILD